MYNKRMENNVKTWYNIRRRSGIMTAAAALESARAIARLQARPRMTDAQVKQGLEEGWIDHS